MRRCFKLTKENTKLKAELARHTEAKTCGGRIAEEWINRVICCAPHCFSRSLVESLHLATGHDSTRVSRWSVNGIRAYWVEVYKRMVFEACSRTVREAHANAREQAKPFAHVFLVHVQDEAELRLLSCDARDRPTVPRRGRASKVQIHALEVLTGGSSTAIPTELEALGDKTAPTLATSFDRLLRDVLPKIMPATGGAMRLATGGATSTWVVHVMVGDGIATNEKAARLLLALEAQEAFAKGIVYFLLVVKCGNHQTALTAASAVDGDLAKAASDNDGAYLEVTATAVRLFKYTIGYYYDDFVHSCRSWVRRTLSPPGLGALPQAASLQRLYSKHVVPDAVLKHLEEVAGLPTCQSDAKRDALVDQWHNWLVTHLFHCDDHPTKTHFADASTA